MLGVPGVGIMWRWLWKKWHAWTGKPVQERSPYWSKTRAAFLKKHPRCEACGSKDDLNVQPKLELVESNLITLCERPTWNCHLIIGHAGNWRKFVPNVDEVAEMQLVVLQARMVDTNANGG